MVRTRPSGRNKCLKMCHELGKPFLRRRVFSAENNEKGNATARWATLITFCPQDWTKLSKIIWKKDHQQKQ